MQFLCCSKRVKNKDKMSTTRKSRINMKEVATAIGMQMLKHTYNIATREQAKMIIEFARNKGADIPKEEEDDAIAELRDLLPEPVQWPTLELNTAGGVSTNSKAPGKPSKAAKKSDDGSSSDKAATRKAKDFNELKAPAGTVITCKVEIKSGDRKGKYCGRECKRVLDEHDPSDPVCAKFECAHMFCGTHIVKAAGGSSVLALGRLEGAKDPAVTPVVMTGDGKTVINTQLLGEIKTDSTTEAKANTMAKILAKVKEATDASSDASTDE